jgi:hypothetical protein
VVTDSVPTVEQFNEFILAARGTWDEKLDALANSLQPTREAVEDFYSAWRDFESARRETASQSAVWQWLRLEPNFSRAMYASGRWRRSHGPDPLQLTDHEFAHRKSRALRLLNPTPERLQHLWEIAQRRQSEHDLQSFESWFDQETQPHALGRRLRSHVNYGLRLDDSIGLYRGICYALLRYHGGGIDADLERHRVLADSARAVSDIRGIIKSRLTPTFAGLDLGRRHARTLPSLLASVDSLEALVADLHKRLIPNIRNDDTLPERILLWDLRRAFHQEFRADKPTALFYMLGVSGVRRPLDKRTVERTLNGWRAKSEPPPTVDS